MFERGSEWRKWDLHIHTPLSIEQHYGENNDITWEKYINDLEKLPEDFSVIGINDYLFLDGYEKVKAEKDNGRLKNIDLILPVLEFRIEKFAGIEFKETKRINLHVIFSNDVKIETIKSQFLNTLEQSYSLESGEKWTRAITKDSVEELGKEIKSKIPAGELSKYGSDLKEGFNNLNVDEKQIFDGLNKDCFRGKYLIAIGKTEWDQLKWTDSSIATKKSIINQADIVFTSSDTVENFNKTKNKLIEQCVNSLLLDCSDAHSFSDSTNKDRIGKCFTWIKADPTFEGLKQIIYEPIERIKVQANKPEEKTGYQAIDRIEIKSDIIVNKELLFNQNLNSIIGGRSTGKSILLASIALKLKLENKPIFNGESKVKYKEFIDSISKDIRIFWKDGKEEYEREVEYFQQSYMYELAKNTKDLDNVIENILREKGKSKDLDEYRNFISTNSKNIGVQVSDLFQIINDLQKVRQLLLELGDKDGVKLEIEKLEKEIKNNTKTEINDSEKQKYDDFKLELEKLQKEIDLNKNDLDNIEKLKSHTFIKDNIDYELLVLLDENRKTLINEEYGKLKTVFKENFELKLIEVSKNIEKRNLEIDIEIKKILEDEIYKKVLLAFKESSQIQELEDKLKIQKNKLSKIEENINKISSLDKQQNSIIENIKKLYKNFEFKTSEVVDVLSDNVDGLEIKAKVTYKENIYRDILSNALDNRTVDNKKYIDGDSTEIFSLFSDIIIGNLSYRSSYNSETLSKRIMSQCLYDISFDLIYENDNFLQMSDGKKAFVVLKLLLDFSNKECPILIDQPEDDLDNRSIYKELVEYLKKKKKQRQIIVATHNPNVVVTADSEEIIVANQHGNGTPNVDGKKFQYISGSLENTQFLDETKLNISILDSQGINEHVCDIVEGGEKAFEQRKKKYNII